MAVLLEFTYVLEFVAISLSFVLCCSAAPRHCESQHDRSLGDRPQILSMALFAFLAEGKSSIEWIAVQS